jgi:hypothetical protein
LEILCPECMGPLAPVGTATAKCTVHGGIYRMLFVRSRASAIRAETAAAATRPRPAEGPAPSSDAARCARHPESEAPFTCARCGAYACQTCVFPQADGSFQCPDCASGRLLGLSTHVAPAVPVGTMCARHPEVAAEQRCANCRTPLCATCDFTFPGDLHFCPDCATSAGGALSGRRKRSLVWSYVLACWSTVAFFGLMIAAAFSRSKGEAEALGIALTVAVLIPSIAGVATSVGALERRQSNSFWIWIAVVWNGLLLGGFLLLSIVGTLRG